MRLLTFIAALAVLVAGTPHAGASQAGTEGENVALLVLPKGDPMAGRQAFRDLMCTSCHQVVGDEELPAPISANPGPRLGPDHGRQKAGELATSILAPSHRISDEVRAHVEGTMSPMGDYSEAMTVRQLIDLVAFLDTLDEK